MSDQVSRRLVQKPLINNQVKKTTTGCRFKIEQPQETASVEGENEQAICPFRIDKPIEDLGNVTPIDPEHEYKEDKKTKEVTNTKQPTKIEKKEEPYVAPSYRYSGGCGSF